MLLRFSEQFKEVTNLFNDDGVQYYKINNDDLDNFCWAMRKNSNYFRFNSCYYVKMSTLNYFRFNSCYYVKMSTSNRKFYYICG